MNCLLCKSGKMTESTTAYFAQLKNCYVIVENVPCFKCDQCGEIVYKASVVEKIDDIIDALEKVSSKIFIVDYSMAA
ncbi:MAG: type II toxin-antitoxin system MqsA family antitoxin [Selenomonadaceae bacterium]|nr:type II toxin-antitoxin system MqsA family antitoxin [Selenomonadaceae bacterium]